MKFARKRFPFPFLALGFLSVIAQVVIQRELINAFYGNEFFIGVVLAAWLLWTAVGSGVLGRALRRGGAIVASVGFVFVAEILLLRLAKNVVGLPGEVPNLAIGLGVALVAPAPVCLLLGAWWTRFTGDDPAPERVGSAYLWEMAGFIVGGVLFSFLLARVPAFWVATIAAALGIALLRRRSALVAAAIVIVIAAGTPILSRLDTATTAMRYPGQTLLLAENTSYGTIDVTKLGQQINLFENGVPLGSTEKTSSAEELAHFALLEHAAPRRVLLIGGGFSGIAREILKHPIERLTSVELDPELIAIERQYADLVDSRFEIVAADARAFVREVREPYDVIIVDLPPPSSALINRYSTREFFEAARAALAADGILEFSLPYSQSAPNPRLARLVSSIERTLAAIFPERIVLPEDVIVFLASMQPLSTDPKVASERLRKRRIETRFLSAGSIADRFTTDRIAQAQRLFKANADVPMNTDGRPSAVLFQGLFWIGSFSGGLASIIEAVGRWFWVVALIAIVAAAARFRRRAPIYSMGAAGFAIMAAEIVAIYGYQIAVGSLYDQIALLIAALTAGMVAGVLCGRKAERPQPYHLGIVLLCAIFSLVFGRWASGPMLFAFAIAAGFFGGAIFPIANRRLASRSTGTIYSADLIGSALGALATSLVVIPFYGMEAAMVLVAVVNLVAIILSF